MQSNLNLQTDIIDMERNILRFFFDKIVSVNTSENIVIDSKLVRDTQNKLKVALRDSKHRCTCARRTWGGPCEVCQSSDNELYSLRNFFTQIRNARKHNMTDAEILAFIENTKKRIAA